MKLRPGGRFLREADPTTETERICRVLWMTSKEKRIPGRGSISANSLKEKGACLLRKRKNVRLEKHAR